MTVRFSQNEIRFRVVPTELDEILLGKTLVLDSYPLRAEISLGKEPLSKKLTLKVSGTQLFLAISRDELELLKRRLPSREGLEEVVELDLGVVFNISFEVDVKAKKRDL